MIARLRYRLLLRRMIGPRLLKEFAREYPRARFVEVGANDGEAHDHLRPFVLANPWTGVMVEPVPHVFARLERNYGGHERVRLENAAITGHDGSMPFFHLIEAAPGERLPDFYDALGSFSEELIRTHAAQIPDFERRLVQTEVPTLTFSSLLSRHGLDGVDLVLVDTEGHDYEVIRTIDLERHRPRLLVYEHFHLSPGDRAACREHLHAAGYETKEEGLDTFCLDVGIDDRLTRRFRRLTPAVAGVSKADEQR